MKRLIVNLPDELSEKLSEEASALGLKKSALAKVAIAKYIK